MDDNLMKKQLRGRFSSMGWALLIYWGIMNLTVSTVASLEMIYKTFYAGTGGSLDAMMQNMLETASEAMTSNGWGYILSCGIGLTILLLWKGGSFLRQEVFGRGKPMTLGAFGRLLCFLASCQILYQFLYIYQEMLLEPLGMSMADTLEAVSVNTDSLSMFLYACLLAPVTEEILFRGLILRTLQPHGRKFAILGSAFLFGMFHGNLVQAPFAFCVGLILGYVALEYNIIWAMVLHMFNNLILGDTLPRLLSGLPESLANGILWLLLIAMTAVALWIAIRKRKEIAARWKGDPLDGKTTVRFFTAPGVIVITAVMWVNMMVVLLMQAIF